MVNLLTFYHDSFPCVSVCAGSCVDLINSVFHSLLERAGLSSLIGLSPSLSLPLQVCATRPGFLPGFWD